MFYSGSCYLCISIIPLQLNTSPDDDSINWRLFVEKGERGPEGDRGPRGSDSGFSEVLGILGGVSAIFGVVALTTLQFANQFQNMKNKLGNISDELQDLADEASDEYRIIQLEKKTKWQNSDEFLTNTSFRGDFFMKNVLNEAKITLSAIEAKITSDNITINNNTLLNNLNVNGTTTIKGIIKLKDYLDFDSITIDNNNGSIIAQDITINNNVNILNNIVVEQKLNVKGECEFLGDIKIKNLLEDNITLINSTGTINTKNFNCSNNVNVDNTLTCKGEILIKDYITDLTTISINNIDGSITSNLINATNINATDVNCNNIKFDENINYTLDGVNKSITKSELDQLNNLLAIDNSVVKLTGNQIIEGNKTFNGTTSGITKNMVGLSNVNDTSDANKPVSNATQTALNLKANDNSVVKLTGNQTITGNKTFDNATVFNNRVTINHALIDRLSRSDIIQSISSTVLLPGYFYLFSHNSGTVTLTMSSNTSANLNSITEIRNLRNGSINIVCESGVSIVKDNGDTVSTLTYSSTLSYVSFMHRTTTNVFVILNTFK